MESKDDSGILNEDVGSNRKDDGGDVAVLETNDITDSKSETEDESLNNCLKQIEYPKQVYLELFNIFEKWTLKDTFNSPIIEFLFNINKKNKFEKVKEFL